ncbi:MAG: ATP-dependent helicase [Firmicutes bacterium]|nr:ATP-dependent helicase [Bacillota bacterium]
MPLQKRRNSRGNTRFDRGENNFLTAEGKVVLCACPGSGKTYVVAQKLLKHVKSWNRPHQGVAVLSFTNVASDEIGKQTKELMPGGFEIAYPHYIGTLDSFINKYILLRFGYLMLKDPRRPTIAIKDVFTIPYNSWRHECRRKGCVENIHDFRWGMDGRLYHRKTLVECPPNNNRKHPPCYECKQTLLKKGFIFQSEVSALAYLLLIKYPEIAKAIATRFPIILLDEAQDTSIEQMAILDLICDNGLESMLLVGDPDQSIYEWRNATPECFIEKRDHVEWMTLPLTANFRSSQLICNATKAFSKTLENGEPSTAKGSNADYRQKPLLLLYDGSIDNVKSKITTRFLELCHANNIVTASDNVAVVTRSRIHLDTEIPGLWKSKEVEFFAQSAFEWFAGSRKKAYTLCEKALYSICIGEIRDIEISIDVDIETTMSYELWRSKVIELLIRLPNPNQPINTWIATMKTATTQTLSCIELSVRDSRTLDDIIKIKNRDQKNPNFKSIPLLKFFESKNITNHTLSSIHGVKGETYDALLLLVESTRGNTLTPSFFNTGDLATELMRIAYVAMTRPRKLLVVAMPQVKNGKYERFPKDKWDYESL